MVLIFGKLLFLITALIPAISSLSGDPCVTPSNQTGVCIIDSDCLAYKNVYKEYFYTNTEYFRRLQCDYEDNYPRICCPTDGYYNIIQLEKPRKKKVRENVEFQSRFGGESDALFPGKEICGMQEYGNKIFNGEVADIDEFPWMALIFYKESLRENKYGCGGVLINDRYVLTAAHCVSAEVQKFGGVDKIRLGEYNVETEEDCVIDGGFEDCSLPPVDIEPEEIIVYPDYDPYSIDQHHDIALIRLKERVVYNDFIRPICLPDLDIFVNYNFTIGSRLYVAGWGRTETGFTSIVKLKLKVPIVNHTKCAMDYYQYNVTVTPCQLCAGGELGKDSCRGDSGGPLMATDIDNGNWICSGIVSMGPVSCGSTDIPGVYTSVKDYLCWIKQVVRH